MKKEADNDGDVASVLDETSSESSEEKSAQRLADSENNSVKSDQTFSPAAELGRKSDRRSVNSVQKRSHHSGVKECDLNGAGH